VNEADIHFTMTVRAETKVLPKQHDFFMLNHHASKYHARLKTVD
jgi:hypothetical protein